MTQSGGFLIRIYPSLQWQAYYITPLSFFLFIHNCLFLNWRNWAPNLKLFLLLFIDNFAVWIWARKARNDCVPFDMTSNILLIQLLYTCYIHAYILSWIEFLNTLQVLISSVISCSTTFAALGELMVQREDGMAGKGYCSFARRRLYGINLACVSERLIWLSQGVV